MRLPRQVSRPSGTEFFFFHMSPKPIYILDMEDYPPPNRGDMAPSLGSESYLSRRAAEGKKSERFHGRREPSQGGRQRPIQLLFHPVPQGALCNRCD
jgi:hypothetical protein